MAAYVEGDGNIFRDHDPSEVVTKCHESDGVTSYYTLNTNPEDGYCGERTNDEGEIEYLCNNPEMYVDSVFKNNYNYVLA